MSNPVKLKRIRLAGFKSFVDPTVIEIASNLVAIVGPNGCGKSNVIDAITWVMGESSAKYLRGELLTDVIFNGSSARKPVGQASVELIFDNSAGGLGGAYASYAEVSIKRVITREGDSSYFLNAARCRRRDVVDIFLGTGLGPRSYSIIGQNMISRIIEAKPDEIRVYIEEAAGISKYKERRRETENRMQHTTDNLLRLSDVRAELDKQLNLLKRQANAAEKFKELKQAEGTKRSQWLVAQWQQLDAKHVEYTAHIEQHETELAARLSQLSDFGITSERNRNEQQAINDVLQEIQRRYYAVGSEIAGIEQEIQYHLERQQQLQLGLEDITREWKTNQTERALLETKSATLVVEQRELLPEERQAKETAARLVNQLNAAENAMQTWQSRYDEFNQTSAHTAQNAQVQQTKIQHLEQKIASLQQLQVKLQKEQEQHNTVELAEKLAELTQQDHELGLITDQYRAELAALQIKLDETRKLQQTTQTELEQLQHEVRTVRGQQTSLTALQQTALGQRNSSVLPWLTQHQLADRPRLAQEITVSAGWERAVETVLADYLQAVCVESLAELAAKLPDLTKGKLCFFAGKVTSSLAPKNLPTLLSKVNAPWPLASILGVIYLADDCAQALQIADTLASHESVVTPDGTWLGATWLKIARANQEQPGILQREQELKKITVQEQALTARQTMLEQALADGKLQVRTLEQQREQRQQLANQDYARKAQLQAQQRMATERLAELESRVLKVADELSGCTAQLANATTELDQVRNTWQDAMHHLAQQATQREQLLAERDVTRDELVRVKTETTQTTAQTHQLELKLQEVQSQQVSLTQAMTRIQSQLTLQTQRKAHLEEELLTLTTTDTLQKNLNAALAKRLLIEDELQRTRSAVESVNQELIFLESKRQAVAKDTDKLRTTLETSKLERQANKTKAETLLEQVAETGSTLEAILEAMPTVAVTVEELRQQLEALVERISRLGPINLVAIDEYAACAERKDYLDQQHHDLQEGLATLSNAIAKIDKETRAKFKETYHQVNERFQELFPIIFGGGRAYLELASDDLLDAGISVMACPPGKRNSTIHLLSGGEKAMTAVAFVFSIFHLNPAPFCLLDEVDAPLDDANIDRFCRLVKSMAEKTQFIFISHNKLAIEMGEHLMGVTMSEPGVSRLVSVDVAEAVSLAGS